MSLSSPYFVVFNSYSIYISIEKTNPRQKYSEDSSDQKKIDNCQQSCFFFLEIQRILITLYVGYQFCIIQKDSKIFIDMSVLYRKKSNYSF